MMLLSSHEWYTSKFGINCRNLIFIRGTSVANIVVFPLPKAMCVCVSACSPEVTNGPCTCEPLSMCIGSGPNHISLFAVSLSLPHSLSLPPSLSFS